MTAGIQMIAVAFIFWIWAIVNSASGSFDFGVLSFLFAMVCGGTSFLGDPRKFAFLGPLGCLACAGNYLAVAILVTHAAFLFIYQVVGFALWHFGRIFE